MTKIQTNYKIWKKEYVNLERSKCPQLYLFWSLNIGICDLFGIWCLGFGIYRVS